MLAKFLIAVCLVVVTVGIHTVGFSALLRAIVWSHALTRSGFWLVTRFMVGLTCWLILIHLTEISSGGCSISGRAVCPMPSLRSIFPQAPTRLLAPAISCCPSRGGCSHRLRH